MVVYLFENVPAGTYSLTVAAQGYQTSDPVTVVVTADETTVVDAIVLQVGPTALDEEDMPAYPVIWLFLPVVADNSPAAAVLRVWKSFNTSSCPRWCARHGTRAAPTTFSMTWR